MDSYFIRRLALFFTFWTLTLLLSACGYSREEKQRMKNIEKLGREKYIPVERYGRGVSVFIQHFYDGRWWQYEEDTHLTTDKQYMIVTSVGYPDSSFDFAVFK